MNDTFNFNRFLFLVRRQWTENKRIYFLILGIISICLLLLNIFSVNHNQDALYIFLFGFGGCALTATLFSPWKNSGQSSLYLLLPASATEKFLAGLFIGLFMYVLVYAINFLLIRYFVTYFLVLLFPNNLLPFSQVIKEGIKEIASLRFSFFAVVFLTLMFLQSICMFCMVRFKKWPFLYFVLILTVVLVVYNGFINLLISKMIGGHGHLIPPGYFLTYYSPDFRYSMDVSGHVAYEHFSFIKSIRNFNFLAWFIVFSLIYVASLFSLKERELN